MSVSKDPNPPAKGQFLVYSTEDGRTKIEVRLENETVWLTQQHMADLFQTTKQNVGQHLKNIFEDGELAQDSVVKNFFTTAADGKDYRTNFYNLDAIISVGYRVKSAVATPFRIWATQQLREFIVKGFVLDDERLKNPDQPFDYFEELLRRIQDIRTSERRFYQKITDIYATIFDILTRPAPELHADERAEVKKAARDLLNRLKQLLVLNWRQKSSARSQLKLAIEDMLDTGLPRAYDKPLYEQKCSAIFEHFYESYPERHQNVYAAIA